MNYVVIALLGALAAVLSNMGVAVFNDGLRPIVPEYIEGRMDKKAIVATSFAMSFGLVVGFGIPVSIAASIILIHSVLLGTDMIGIWAPRSRNGAFIAGAAGALYGIGLVAGLQFIVDLFEMLPVNFLGSLSQVSSPVTAAFAIFPALVVAYQFGYKNGMITFAISFIVRQLVTYYGKFTLGTANISLNPEGMALLTGMVIMLFYATREKQDKESASVDLTSIFADRVKKIKKNLPILAVMGGLISAATSLTILAGDPISLNLMAEGQLAEGGLAALARAIGFVPLVATTAITTGVYAPAGMTFVFVVGFFVSNPFLAFVLGAAVMSIEILLLEVISKGLDRFPGVKKAGDNIRTAMTKVLEVALLLGGLLSAYAMAQALGLYIVIGLYVLNKTSKKPIVEMAVGPVGAIATGVIINILYLVGLYQIPA